MYIPTSFLESDLGKLHEFISANSFATLVSTVVDSPDDDPQGPTASHLPLLLDPFVGSQGQLVGHMAAANSHWRHLDGKTALAIFSGPHAYISPAWSETANVVPTWNYIAVHAYGKVRIERDPQRLGEIVKEFVDFYEAGMPQPWRLESADPEFIRQLCDAIVGFTIEIERLEGKWKLSQNHTPARRRRVIQGLESLGGEYRQRTARLMAETMD